MLLNCDLGEGYGAWQMGDDVALMPYLDMANIACGMHAGDPKIMQRTIALALDHQVEIGAHIGYDDKPHFGRRSMDIFPEELRALSLVQMGALDALCSANDAAMTFVKPHGALYNQMMQDWSIFCQLVQIVADFSKQLDLVIMAVPDFDRYKAEADRLGVTLRREAFVDRVYSDDGRLMSRDIPGSCHADLDAMLVQARSLSENQCVRSESGKVLLVEADTLCVHGDGELAVPLAHALRQMFDPN